MAKVISQETFDDVVKENIVDFSMSTDEAKEETIKQFTAQGINLANIIKDLSINEESGRPVLNEGIDKLQSHISGEKKLDNIELISILNVLETECKKSIAHRVLAAKNGAHNLIVTLLDQEISHKSGNRDILVACLNTANALTNKQPDIFDAEALALTIQLLNNEKDLEIINSSLQWIAKACILHEINRQNIMSADIIKYLKPLVSVKDPKTIRAVCTVFRYLILDDDIRVEFGKAHEHARIISSEVLTDLTKLLPEYEDINVLCDLLLTIASLVVRHELCIAVEDAGGLKFVFNLLMKFHEDLKFSREALKLLRALAGNDTTKIHIVQQGAAPIIQDILNIHKSNESLAVVALACISTLTLRVKENSVAFFEAGISETIVETMKLHPKSKLVQRNAAWAIRNMVSRSRDQCDSFLSHGAEELLNSAMIEHSSVHQDIKAALRDLGCKVELKEEWTGRAEKKIIN